MTPDTKYSQRSGRPRFRRNDRTMDSALLEAIASEALEDGQLLIRPERLAYVLQISPATVKSLMDSGDLPVCYVDHTAKRLPRVVAEDVLKLVRRRSSHQATAAS